jgi:hypothetical protein
VKTADSYTDLGESRWPPVLALLLFIVLNVTLRVWLPSAAPVRVPFLVPAVEATLLVLLLTVSSFSRARVK